MFVFDICIFQKSKTFICIDFHLGVGGVVGGRGGGLGGGGGGIFFQK